MRREGIIVLLLAALLGPSPAFARPIVTSAAPDSVEVTVYRDPNRGADVAINLGWLNGFALISETRVVRLPAGESDIRFEGVAGGILPQSAIVAGLPDGIVERNRDAYLLSPATLLDRSLGRRVHLRRTSLATGEVREHEAVVRSGAGGAVVLETMQGIEALRCTGLRETIVYDGVPAGLSARPTLSVRARSREAIEATVTLSYLSSGLDWQADYVATLSPDGESLALFAWLTLANGDETGFVDADAQAVAGRLNRADARVPPPEGGPLVLQCWPQGTTSDLPLEDGERLVVTGSRLGAVGQARADADGIVSYEMSAAPTVVMEAVQEELGDLKLYRIPEPVTVAARSQKQVALLQRPQVQVRTVYRQRLQASDSTVAAEARHVLVTRNRTEEGLGLPLPAGRLMLFSSGPRPILLGQGIVRDRAVGEDVEIELGPVPGVRTELRLLSREKGARDYELVVTSDRPHPVRFEGEIDSGGAPVRSPTRLGRRNGMPLWVATIPAHGSASLRYRIAR